MLPTVDDGRDARTITNEPVSESDTEYEHANQPTPPPTDHEAEYIDEEKYTTVTVEEMDVSREGLHKLDRVEDNGSEDDEQHNEVNERPNADSRRKWTRETPRDKVQKPRKKKKKFRYENKAERKQARLKEKAKNSRQAQARRNG